MFTIVRISTYLVILSLRRISTLRSAMILCCGAALEILHYASSVQDDQVVDLFTFPRYNIRERS